MSRILINSCCILAALITGCSHSSKTQNPAGINARLANENHHLDESPTDFLKFSLPLETCPDPNQFTHIFPREVSEILRHIFQVKWLHAFNIYLTKNCEHPVFVNGNQNEIPFNIQLNIENAWLQDYLRVTFSSLFVSRGFWARILLLEVDNIPAADQEAHPGILVSDWVRYKQAILTEVTASGGVNNLGVIAMPKDVMIIAIQKRLLCAMKRVLELLFIDNQEYYAFGGVQYLISEMESHGLVVEQEFVDNAKNFYQKVLVGRLDLLIDQFAQVEPIPGAPIPGAPIQPLNENIAICAQMNVDAVIHILLGAANQRPIEHVAYSRFYRIILSMLSVTSVPHECNPIATNTLYPNAMLILGRDILASEILIGNFDDSEFRASMAIATALWVQETMERPNFLFTQSLTRSEFVGIITKFRNILAEYGNALKLNYPYNKNAQAYIEPLVPLSAVLQPSSHHENVVVRNRLSRLLGHQPRI